MFALSYSTSNWKSAARIGICLLSSLNESLTWSLSLQMLCCVVLWAAMSSLAFFGELALLLLVEAVSVSFSVYYKISCFVIIACL